MNEQPRQTLNVPGERVVGGFLAAWERAWNNPDPHNHNPHSRSPTARRTIGVRAMQMQCKAVWVHASFLMSRAWWVSETALICKANAMHHNTKTMEKFYALSFFVIIIIIVVFFPGHEWCFCSALHIFLDFYLASHFYSSFTPLHPVPLPTSLPLTL